jgi:3-phosphoshikimate 1-carboxyvinyltransferase
VKKTLLWTIPPLVPIAIVAAALLGRSGTASGLHTLNAKESPRLDATADWLGLLGCSVTKGTDWINWEISHAVVQSEVLELDCRGDHRMAFCAALISLKWPVRILGSDSVSKSFPDFWEQFGALAG